MRRADGTLEEKADAPALTNLVFTWLIQRGGQQTCHESQVRCHDAWERGVPRPQDACCTKAELDQIAANGATKYQDDLRKRERRDDVFVECKCPMRTLNGIHVFLWRMCFSDGTRAFGPTTATSTWRWAPAKRHTFPLRGSSAAPTGRRLVKCKSVVTMQRCDGSPGHRPCIAQWPYWSSLRRQRHRSAKPHCVKKSNATISVCNAGGGA